MMLNKGNTVGAIVTNISKTFDTLSRKPFICKLKAYDFDKNALNFIQSYQSNRHQRTKVGDEFSIWQKNLNKSSSRHRVLNPFFQHFY